MSSPTVTEPMPAPPDNDMGVTVRQDVGVTEGHRPRALVTARLRGDGFDRLHGMTDVVYDPWIDQQPAADLLAAAAARAGRSRGRGRADRRGRRGRRRGVRAAAAGGGRHPRAIRSTSTSPRRPPPGCPCSTAPVATPTRWPSWRWLSSSPSTARLLPADPTCEPGRSTATAPSLTSASGRGSWPAGPPGWSGSGRSGRALRWRLEGLGLTVIAHDPYSDEATGHRSTSCSSGPTSSPCTLPSPRRRRA